MTDLLVPHRLPGPPVAATLVERENRFLARCRLVSGEEVHAHVPDRGRLVHVLVPGTEVLLYASSTPGRRTAWSLLVAREPASGTLVAIDPAGANARVFPLLERGLVEGLGGGWTIRREVAVGASRLDFLLTRGSERVAVEVKSVGVVEGGVALFPDAPTERGVKHLGELEQFARTEGRAAVIFCAQRGDARAVAADERIDPAFAAALRRVTASRAVEAYAVAFDVLPVGCLYRGSIPLVEDPRGPRPDLFSERALAPCREGGSGA